MNEPTRTWIRSVEAAVNKLHAAYQMNRGMLLTEGDLECHLFHRLMQEADFQGFHRCKNDSVFQTEGSNELRTSYVHSQVTWFKPDKKSGFEVDLTIANPEMLEVMNIELFERWTHKGFAYDGPCIAIELKFIRHEWKASHQAQEDYVKLRDKIIPAKIMNIENHQYQNCDMNNVAFITIVACKTQSIFERAMHYLGKHINDVRKPTPSNLITCIFYQDEIVWDKNAIVNRFKSYYQ